MEVASAKAACIIIIIIIISGISFFSFFHILLSVALRCVVFLLVNSKSCATVYGMVSFSP